MNNNSWGGFGIEQVTFDFIRNNIKNVTYQKVPFCCRKAMEDNVSQNYLTPLEEAQVNVLFDLNLNLHFTYYNFKCTV